MMTKEEFTSKMNEITENLEDQGKVTATLTELYNGFENVFNDNESLKTKNEELTNANKELKEYNFDLFRQVGSQNKDNGKEKGKTSLDAPDGKEEPTLKYEDLFNEKGEFK